MMKDWKFVVFGWRREYDRNIDEVKHLHRKKVDAARLKRDFHKKSEITCSPKHQDR